ESPRGDEARDVAGTVMTIETKLVLGWLAFGGSHMALSAIPVRTRLIGTMGLRAFKGVYTGVALVTFIILFRIYWVGRHAGEFLFDRTLAGRHVTELIMLLAVACIALSHGSHSPATTSAEMREEWPSEPRGIHRITRHPQNLGFALFGLA